MMKKRLSKKIWYGSDVDSEGNPVLPPLAIDSDDLEGLHYGELYLHIADDKLSLWTRTLTDQVKQIGGSGSGDGGLWQLRQTDAGDPYLFSPFDVAVQRGLTSFVDGGSLDLPSIYDGLPIDNQTLYWEEVTEQVGTDEEGNPIYETTKVLKAQGGGSGGGGSVKSLLKWSGFREGSWDGSEEKTIEIPAKLSELENDGKFFADGGWIGSDANSVIFGSYLYGGYAANTPKNVGQLLAFNNGDLESWNRGSQIFIEGENFYYRQFWDNYWRNWRKVISGNSDGVIDYDLTLGGNLTINGEEYNEIKTVYNPDYSIGNLEELGWNLAIRHALRFRWHDEAYEIGTIRGASSNSAGFGITHQNNHLVWQVNREQMDVYEDLKVHGNIVIDTDNLSAIDVSHRSSSLWNFALTSFNPIMPDGSLEIIEFGKGQSAYNAGSIGFKYFSDSSPNNMMTISLFNADEILNITGHRKVGINTTTPRYDLEVNGHMGVYGDLRLKDGLIQYNEEGGYFYLEGNLVVSGGISSYVDVGNLNLPSIYDGLPIDKTTIGWKEVTDASGAKSKVLGIIGDIDDTVMWSDIEGIPSWIGSSKPSYSYSEISGTPNLGEYVTSDKLDDYLPLSGGTIDGMLNIKVNGTAYECLTAANVNPASNSSVNTKIYTPKEIGNNGQILVVKNQSMGWRNASEIKAGGLTVTNKTAWGQTYWTSSGVPDTIDGDMTNVGSIKPKTNAASDIGGTGAYFRDAYVQRVRVNGGWLSYNASQNYFELDGNLLVTGGITAFADSGSGNQWILDTTSLSNVTSTNQYKVYSARVTSKLATEVINLQNKMNAIKDALAGISGSSSLKAIGDALNSIYSALN